jgi:hypothetical protein
LLFFPDINYDDKNGKKFEFEFNSENLINDSLQKALEQEKIQAIGSFELSIEFDELLAKFDPEQTLTFTLI